MSKLTSRLLNLGYLSQELRPNSTSRIFFPAATRKILYRLSRGLAENFFGAAAANRKNYSATAVMAAA